MMRNYNCCKLNLNNTSKRRNKFQLKRKIKCVLYLLVGIQQLLVVRKIKLIGNWFLVQLVKNKSSYDQL